MTSRQCARLLLAVALACSCASTPPARTVQSTTLAGDLDRLAATPPLDKAVWGVAVEEEDGRVLYARNARNLMIPASVRKLFAAFAVEECTGVDAVVRTDVLLDGAIDRGHLAGDLVVRGSGDPSLGGRYDGWAGARFAPVLAALRARGVAVIDGGVVADVSAFDRVTIPEEWWTGDVGASYAAPVDALSFGENVIDLSVDSSGCPETSLTVDPQFLSSRSTLVCGSAGGPRFISTPGNEVKAQGVISPGLKNQHFPLAVADAGLFTAQALDDLLRRGGIHISHPPAVRVVPMPGGEALTTLISPPVGALLSTVLKNSQNLYAEMLLKRLASGDQSATYERALEIEREVITAAGIDPSEFRFVDGSGVAHINFVTPQAVIGILRAIEAKGGIFRTMMATPGEEGTLRRRLRDQPLLRAKTGTLSGVSSLAGFAPGPDGALRFFALIVNHATADSGVIEAVLDQMAERILAEGPAHGDQ